jgi:GNAT superfamily N-acetyltransferase
MTDPIHIRPARPEDAAAIARVQVDSYRSAHAGILPQDYLEQLSCDDQESNWLELLTSGTPDVILVAATGDSRLAGYARGTAQPSYGAPYDSELMSLHVRRALHRKGTGRRLLSATAARLAARGCSAMMLWVLEANPARGFYEHLGATRLEGHRLFVGAPEVPYGWPDLQAIASLADGGDD